jgi:hypothetical protein
MTTRNKLFAQIAQLATFTITPTKTEKATLLQFEAEGLITLKDASDGIHTLWQVARA